MGRHRRSRRLLAAGAATILAGGCATAAAGTRPGTATPTAATVTGWVRSAAGALDLGGGASATLAAVVAPQAPGDGWVAVGTRQDGAGATTATVWTSSDALTWRAIDLPGTDGRALAAAAFGPRTVVVGSVRVDGRTEAAVWTTAGPGLPFTLVPPSAALAPTPEAAPSGPPVTGSASMDVVAAGTQGVFAAGSVSGRQAVWYSSDGTSWARLSGAERVIDGSPGAEVTSMLVTPDAVLAAGTVRSGTFTDGVVWSSADGITWRDTTGSVGPFSGAGDHRIDGLAAGTDDSLVAVGGVRSGATWIPASWVSPTGTAWSQPSEALPEPSGPQPSRGGAVARAAAATPTGSGLVTVGGTATAQSVWTSTDGLDWRAVALPVPAADSPSWSADLVATSGATTVVADATPGQPRVLVHRRGQWRELPPSTFATPAPVATPAGMIDDDGRLVVAVDVETPAAGLAGVATSRVDVLGSDDGTHWRLLATGGALRDARLDDLVLADGTIVAVGSAPAAHGSRATVWTSATGRHWKVVGGWGGASAAPQQATTATAFGARTAVAGSGPADGDAGLDAPGVAQAWSVGADGRGRADGPLDGPVTPVGSELPLGSCASGSLAVVVGEGDRRGVPVTTRTPSGSEATTSSTVAMTGSPSGPDGQGDDGTTALTWRSDHGGPWIAGTISPQSGAGGGEAMEGCASTGTSFVAWGTTPGAGGAPVPALWTSTDGADWVLRPTPTLSVPGSSPLTSLETDGPTWLAVSGGHLAATQRPDDPDATADDPVLLSAAPADSSGPDGSAGVWASADAGTTWARVPTTGPAWSGPGRLSTDLVDRLGATVVVVGQVGGRLAVWTGRVS